MEAYVTLEFTPNPNTLKYAVNRTLLERGAASFSRLEAARGRSPLAAKLLEVPGIVGVMIGHDFVTITKSEEGDWDAVHQSAARTIETHLATDEPVVIAQASEGATVPRPEGDPDQETERKIVEFLDREIRPAVAMDGGDISLERYEDGVVYLNLQGSCSGCPSSTMTLKMGIETRLREAMPEIVEVVAV